MIVSLKCCVTMSKKAIFGPKKVVVLEPVPFGSCWPAYSPICHGPLMVPISGPTIICYSLENQLFRLRSNLLGDVPRNGDVKDTSNSVPSQCHNLKTFQAPSHFILGGSALKGSS